LLMSLLVCGVSDATATATAEWQRQGQKQQQQGREDCHSNCAGT